MQEVYKHAQAKIFSFAYLMQAYPNCRNRWNKCDVGGHFG